MSEIKNDNINNYFQTAGDLTNNVVYNNSSVKITEESKDKYFQTAGDLPKTDIKTEPVDKTITIDQINNFILTVVSGKEYPYECELGTVCSAGSMIITLDEFVEMANDDSYNIISAECLNTELISIQYQQYNKNKIRGL